MNLKCLFISLLVGLFAGGQAAFGADSNGNLITNPEFQRDSASKLAFWKVRYGNIEEMLTEGSKPGTSAVKLPMFFRESPKYPYGNVLSQQVKIPVPGTYIVTVNLSPSRTFNEALIVIFYTDPKTGKTTYAPNGRLKIGDYPIPGEWKKKCFEVNIPEKVEWIGFCVELRDFKEDGFLKIERPSFILREE